MEEESTPNIWDTVINRLQGKTSVYGDQEAINQNDLKLLQLRLQDPKLTMEQRQVILDTIAKATPKATPKVTPTPGMTIATPAPKPKAAITTPAPKPEVAPPAARPAPKSPYVMAPTPVPTEIPAQELTITPTTTPIATKVKNLVGKPPTEVAPELPLPKDPFGAAGTSPVTEAPREEETLPNKAASTPSAAKTDFGKQVSKSMGFGLNAETPELPPASFKMVGPGVGAFTAPHTSESIESGTITKKTESPQQLQDFLKSQLTAQEEARRNYLAAVGEYQKTGYPQDLQTRETEQKRSYDEYLRRLDSNRKAEFWDKIIGALGKITAGTVGLKGLSGIPGLPAVPAGLDVASHYSFTPAVDRKAEDTYAEQLRKTQAARAEEIFKSKMERALGGPKMQMEASAFTDPAGRLAKAMQESMGGERTETGKKAITAGTTVTPLTDVQIHGAQGRGGEKRDEYKLTQGAKTIEDFGKDLNLQRTGLNNIRTIEKGKPTRNKNEYVNNRTAYTQKGDYVRLPSAALGGIYDEKLKETGNHAAAAEATDRELEKLLVLPTSDPKSDAYQKWYWLVDSWDKRLPVPTGILASLPSDVIQKNQGLPERTYVPPPTPTPTPTK